MTDLTHRVESRVTRFFTLIHNIQRNGYNDEFGINENIGFNVLGFISEFEELKKELPETYPKYIEKFHKNYRSLLEMLSSLDLPRNDNNEFEIQYLNRLSNCLNQITEHLNGLLNSKIEIQTKEQPKSIVRQMEKSIYEKVKNRISQFHRVIDAIDEFERFDENDGKIDIDLLKTFDYDIEDPLKYIFEFDQLKKELPDTYKKYIPKFLVQYQNIGLLIDSIEITPINEKHKHLINELPEVINDIIEHLRGMLNDENEIQEPQKPIAPPKGQTVLSQKQSVLLYWYLRENKIISKSVKNKNLATAIELMTGHGAEQNQEIIKSTETDVWKLGKGNEKVVKNDFVVVVEQLEKLIIMIRNDSTKKTK